MLSPDIQTESMRSVVEFLAEEGAEKGLQNMNVMVQKDGEPVFSDSVPVVLSADHDSAYIDIFWEDAGLKNFKEKGLKGRYFSKLCEIERKNNMLLLTPQKGLRIIIS